MGTIGSKGTDPGQFDLPEGVALDAQGNIYVSEMNSGRIQKLAPDATPLAVWGRPGTGLGEFRQPVGMSIAADGTIYVADMGNDRIQKLSPNGAPLAAWSGFGNGVVQLSKPIALTVLSGGGLLIADQQYGVIVNVAPNGNLLSERDGTGQAWVPERIEETALGVYAVDSKQHRVRLGGLGSGTATQDATPSPREPLPPGVVLDAQRGLAYLVDPSQHRVLKLARPTRPLARPRVSVQAYRTRSPTGRAPAPCEVCAPIG